MKLLKTFALLALAGVLAFDAGTAFARDTRTDTDRPRTDNPGKGDGDGDDRHDTEPTLPKGTEGITCKALNGDPPLVLIDNDTGATIPAGSVVKVYVQPGNIQKLYELKKPWAAGEPLLLQLDVHELELPAVCSVKVKLVRDDRAPDGPFSKNDIRLLTKTETLKLPHRAVTVECTMELMGDGTWYAHVSYKGAPGQIYWPMKLTLKVEPTGATYVAQAWDDWGDGFDFTYGDATVPPGDYATPPTCTASIY